MATRTLRYIENTLQAHGVRPPRACPREAGVRRQCAVQKDLRAVRNRIANPGVRQVAPGRKGERPR
eukprot:7249810-Lingulodinium_polyedra.AAC.1